MPCKVLTKTFPPREEKAVKEVPASESGKREKTFTSKCPTAVKTKAPTSPASKIVLSLSGRCESESERLLPRTAQLGQRLLVLSTKVPHEHSQNNRLPQWGQRDETDGTTNTRSPQRH